MTKMVIMTGMSSHPVTTILDKWPSRRAILEDARRADPSLELIAVHRWFQRKSIPPHRWNALVTGARRRKLGVSLSDLAAAHSRGEQTGHGQSLGRDAAVRQGGASEKVNGNAA